MRMGRAARNRAAKKRKEARTKLVVAIRMFTWKVTALWCWLHILVAIVARRDIFSFWEARASGFVYRTLVTIGFASSNQRLLPIVSKLFWILCITQFSWAQLIGLSLYVLCAPVWFPLYLVFRKRLKNNQANQTIPPSKIELINTDFSVTAFLVASLAGWFALYGSSTSRFPLIVALVLTGSLFATRVYAAFTYTTGLDPDKGGLLATITMLPFALLLSFLRIIVTSGAPTVSNSRLEAQIRTQQFVLRLLRRVSAYLHGRDGRKRAALLVLFKYMTNLAILGFLTIAFWALAIKLYKVPALVSMSDALLASASHVIPGVPDADGIKVNAGIQAGISLTAWAIFVLYAGPVASVFPMLQERYMKHIADYYQTLRAIRVMLRRIINDFRGLLGQQANPINANVPSLSPTDSPTDDNASSASAEVDSAT
jgi:hypothetical protein